MPLDPQSEPTSFKLTNFRNVDANADTKPYVDFLDRFAASFGEMIDLGLELLRLHRGSRVLDVGCGPGTILPALAMRVGAEGRVTGIDLSHVLVAEAQRRMSGSGLPVDIEVGNAQALRFDDAAFDAARADRVIAFVPDPRSAVSELVRVTRPGGRVVATEPDLGASIVDAADAAATRAVLAAVSDEFPNGWMGRRLRALFLDAGLTDVEVRFFAVPNTSFADWSQKMGIPDALRIAATAQCISSAQAEAWLDDLRARDATGQFLASNTLCMVAGTKPGLENM